MLWQTSLVPDEWSDRRDALPQGSVLRDYTIEEVLGHGGFGIVYKARHNELDHVVAIKEYLPSELAVREGTTVRPRGAECETYFADGLRRFRDEAKALIDFQQHASVVDCRDFFRANGTAYLVMEYVEGLPLSDLLRQREAAGRPFTESDLLGIAIPLAEGLAHIHQAGVIHRDIKPANILVRKSNQSPVLIDFGAAKQAVAEHSRSLAPYTEGYAALEQVADGQLGPWTDLYGFGAVLWRMVAGGTRPWDPPNPVKVEGRANAGLRDAEDPLPTARELGVGRFADRLLELIDGCLRLKDTDRIRESERVVQVLQASGEGGSLQPATAGRAAEGGHDVDRPDPVSVDVRTGRFSTGRLWKVVGVAAAIAVVVALAAVALIPRNGTVEMPDRWSFSIEAEPSTATVALLNGPEAYRSGMLLPPGQYQIEVGAPGFVTRRERVTHSESETRHQVELEPLSDAVPEPVQTQSDEKLEAANTATLQREQVHLKESTARKPVVTDSAVASDSENSDMEANEASPSNCGAGARGWVNCLELGESYRNGDGVPRDTTRAAEFYQQACEGGVAEGCYSLGFMYNMGEGLGKDRARAGELFQQACEGGSADGCLILGFRYDTGEGRNRVRAAEFYRQACEGGSAAGCAFLGRSYYQGEGLGRDWARAAKFYQQACEGGYARGCLNLGNMYSNGEGVPLDRARAAELLQQVCEGGFAEGCNNLGFLYSRGYGVRQDPARAAELYQQACNVGYALGCYNIGVNYENGSGVDLDQSRATEYYHQACTGNDMRGCAALATNYYLGRGIDQDRSAAKTLFQAACTNGHEDACEELQTLDWR